MCMEYIERELVPEKLVCPSCGSRHVKLYGELLMSGKVISKLKMLARKVETS